MFFYLVIQCTCSQIDIELIDTKLSHAISYNGSDWLTFKINQDNEYLANIKQLYC